MCDLEATVSNCRRHRCCVCGRAFVSAMIVCYLKPKLRARVVLLLVTILVIASERSGSYCDTACFFFFYIFVLHTFDVLMHNICAAFFARI